MAQGCLSVVFRLFEPAMDIFWCSLLNDGRFCCLFSQPPSTQVPGICSPVLLFDVYHLSSLHLVPFFWRIVMENVVPQNNVVVFLRFACCLFFPLLPRPCVTVVYSRCVPRREEEKRKGKLCISLSTQHLFTAATP